jgi:phosphatidylinositol-3-phosphatase
MRRPIRTIATRLRVAGLVLAVGLAASACAGSSPTPGVTPSGSAGSAKASAGAGTPTPTTGASLSASPAYAASPSPTSAVPDFAHVYVIVMENKEYNRIVGSSAAPYENSLIARYGSVTAMYGERHPSEPNYIALTSGGLQGTDSDGTYNLDVPNLFDQVEASGRTWHVYAQGYPGGCYKGSSADSVVDGPGAAGDYARKHNPAMSYTSISGNPARCANITGLKGFDPAAADFEFIAPNQINDMHSSSVAAGDAFLKVFVPTIVDSPAFANSVLFITWDEGDSNTNGGGHIATIVVSPGMPAGSTFAVQASHYSILRTIELAWGLPLLGQAATAPTLDFKY